MTSSLLTPTLATFVAVALVVGAGWRMRRRPVRTPAPSMRVGHADAPPARPAAGTAAATSMPDPAPMLQRLWTIALPEPSTVAPPGSDAALLRITRSVLARVDAHPRYAPRRPQVLPQLMRVLNDPDASGTAIARVIGQDPALTANLLRVANSAFYRVQDRPVDSLDRAVVLVGAMGLRQIVAAALVQPVAGAGGALARLSGLLWEHTVLSAAAAAEHARHHDGDVFAAQLVGLLHGLGAVAVTQVLGDQLASRAGRMPAAAVVMELLHECAAPTAQRLAGAWHLTGPMATALDAQRIDFEGETTGLAQALRFGRWGGALALLAQREAMPADEALAQLRGCMPDAADTVWARLHRPLEREPAARTRG